MSVNINKIQDEIVEEFSKLDDWLDKYEYLINLGKSLNLSDEKLKLEENLLNGCQSNVWIIAENLDGKIHYTADSDSLIIKGIISLLLRVLNEQNAQDIVDADLYFLDKIGLKSNLSPSRANGLVTILSQIKTIANNIKDIKN
jgi:cysteine desulfuration protein SufE